MKKLLIIFVVIGFLYHPILVTAKSENQTLGDIRQELKEMQRQKANKENEKKKTQAEIDANKNNIAAANNEIEEAKKQITLLGEDIIKNNEEMDKLKKENEDLMVLYQKLENENIYLSYITGASSLTDLIMRMDAINQVAEYNEQKINNLELLIKSNNKMSKELEKYQTTLDAKITEYESMISSLGEDLADLVEGAEDLDSEIQGKKELIKVLEAAGCKDNDLLSVCLNFNNAAGWTRPLTRGKITSPFGWRIHPTKGVWKFHNGIDIGGNSEGTKIYSSAAGVVGKITRKSSCGGNMVYIWVYVKGVPYTVVYMHLLDVYVNVGDAVNVNTVIGTVGGGKTTQVYDKCSTGAHLHYGVSKNNHYLSSKSDTYSKFTANMINPPNFPAYGSTFYSR